MHHAWREPSLLISCPSCLLISTIKSKTIMSQIMLGRKARHPRNQHRVLGARLGNLTLANSMPVDGGTKVGDDLGRHQTRTSPETLVQEGSPDTVVTERNSGRTEQGRSRRFGTRAKPQVQTQAQATSLGSSRWTSLKRTVSGETINTPGLTPHQKASAG